MFCSSWGSAQYIIAPSCCRTSFWKGSCFLSDSDWPTCDLQTIFFSVLLVAHTRLAPWIPLSPQGWVRGWSLGRSQALTLGHAVKLLVFYAHCDHSVRGRGLYDCKFCTYRARTRCGFTRVDAFSVKIYINCSW